MSSKYIFNSVNVIHFQRLNQFVAYRCVISLIIEKRLDIYLFYRLFKIFKFI